MAAARAKSFSRFSRSGFRLTLRSQTGSRSGDSNGLAVPNSEVWVISDRTPKSVLARPEASREGRQSGAQRAMAVALAASAAARERLTAASQASLMAAASFSKGDGGRGGRVKARKSGVLQLRCVQAAGIPGSRSVEVDLGVVAKTELCIGRGCLARGVHMGEAFHGPDSGTSAFSPGFKLVFGTPKQPRYSLRCFPESWPSWPALISRRTSGFRLKSPHEQDR